MLLNMIVINLTWIVGIIPNVWKTFPAISRTSLQKPACGPVHHTAQVHRDEHRQLNLVPSWRRNNTSASKF